MRRSFILTLLLACLLQGCPRVAAAPTPCVRLEQQRDRIHEQLRRGHGAAKGNRLRARLRELNAQIGHNCR